MLEAVKVVEREIALLGDMRRVAERQHEKADKGSDEERAAEHKILTLDERLSSLRAGLERLNGKG